MSELIAVLDLGSNAARFLLARIEPGVGYRVLSRQRASRPAWVRNPRGHLPQEAIDLTLASASRFLASLGNGNGTRPRVMAVATAAVRDAPNRDQLIDPLRVREGVDVSSAAARRRTSARSPRSGACRSGTASSPTSAGAACSSPASVPGPCNPSRASRSARSGSRDGSCRRSADLARAARAPARGARRVLGVLPPARRGDELIGLGGTVRALARLHLEADARDRPGRPQRHGLRLHQSDVTAVRERLEAVPLRRRRASAASRPSAPTSSWPGRSRSRS